MKLTHVSASQVKTFQRCNRRWYFEKIMKKRGPSTHSQRRGTAIHEALEVFVKTGETIEEVHTNIESGRVVPDSSDESETFLVKRFVEATKEHILDEEVIAVEGKISLETFPGGPKWIGFIDLLSTERVIDYKTTTNLRYAKTPADLLEDVQSCSYALSVFRKFPQADEFDVKFIYIHTGNKIKVNIKPVEATFTREKCEEVFLKAVGDVKKMVIFAQKTDPDEIPCNSDACMDFFKLCDHSAYCKRTHKSSFETKAVKKPNRFTHPELFRKSVKVKPITLRPPEVKEDEII